jgi:hypothetical protein
MQREWLRVGLLQEFVAHESQQQRSLDLIAEPLKLLLGLPDLLNPVAVGGPTNEVDDATLRRREESDDEQSVTRKQP